SKLLSVAPIASGLQNVNKVIFIFSECNVKIIYTLRAYPIRAILLAILDLGKKKKKKKQQKKKKKKKK
ncbi:hypothetical protein K791_00375, partial [Salmonella enterica subsp. enterica serovar Newport str. SHSN001]